VRGRRRVRHPKRRQDRFVVFDDGVMGGDESVGFQVARLDYFLAERGFSMETTNE
jgi:hypothetical protein